MLRRVFSGVLFASSQNIKTMSKKKILCLFDVDGTLTVPRNNIEDSLKSFLLDKVATKAEIALVGGSDYGKIREQMGGAAGM